MSRAAALVLLAALALYAPSAEHFFVSDDFLNIERNQFRTVAEMLDLFSTRDIDFYRPIPRLHFGFFDGLFGDRVLFWNLGGILLHGLTAVAAAALAADLLGPARGAAARWTGLFFAIHFVHAEPVVWASGVTSIWVTLFVLLALLLLRRAHRSASPRLLAGSVLALALALMSKETAVAFVPLAVLAALVWPPGRHADRGARALQWRIAEVVPFAILLSVYALIALSIERGGDSSPYRFEPGWHLPKNVAFFVLGSFVPVRYWMIERIWSGELGGSGSFASELLHFPLLWVPLGLGAVLLAFAAVRGGRDVRGGLAWILAAALPFLALPGSGERFLYLPSFGACLVLGVLVAGTFERVRPRAFAWGIAGGLVVLHALGSLDRQGDWVTAARWTRGIRDRWSYLGLLEARQPIEFVGIPGEHRSAWVFRNGFESMVRLYWDGRPYWREEDRGGGPRPGPEPARMGVVLGPEGSVGMMPAHLLPERRPGPGTGP